MAGNAHHVLVIEDDAETAEQLVDCLRTHGYVVDLSMDGEGAAQRSRSASLGPLAYSWFSRRLGVFPPRASVARVEAINATSREIIETGLRRRIPVRGTGDVWDGLAKNLVRCSTASRIWLRRTGR